MLKLPNSIEPAVMAENIVHLRDAENLLDGRVSDLESTAPKDYSTTETATGQKWVDGREIYSRVISNTAPIMESATNITVLTDIDIDEVLYFNFIINSSNTEQLHLSSVAVHNKTTGTVIVYSVPDTYSGEKYKSIILYVKKVTPGRAPEDSDQEPEPEEKKTTRKKTTK